MAFIALQRLKVGHDGNGPVYREFGEHIPEAETWPFWLRHQYEREGHIKESFEPAKVPAPKATAKAGAARESAARPDPSEGQF